MKGQPTLTVTSDFTADFNRIVKSFQRDAVLVGIPAADTTRDDDAPITHAALLAMANFGSPANNIPAWPVMAIGIKNAQDAIAEQFAKAAKEVLTKGTGALETYYDRAGFIASNSIKRVLNDQEGVPSGKPEDSTMDARKSRGFKGTKYWVVSGQMRNAITYVVKSVWGR
jgi:hypothetical protein